MSKNVTVIGGPNISTHVATAIGQEVTYCTNVFDDMFDDCDVLIVSDPHGWTILDIISFIIDVRSQESPPAVILLVGRMSLTRYSLETALQDKATCLPLEDVITGSGRALARAVNEA